MNVDQKLLEQIVFEVIERLHVQTKPKLLLIHDGKQKREKLEGIISELQDHWQLRLYEVGRNARLEELEPMGLQHLAFLDVDQDLISRAALGLTDTPASLLLAKALREGCPVLLEPCKDVQWLLSAPDEAGMRERSRPYRTHLLQYKDTLIRFGAWFGVITAWRPSELLLNRKLVSERDIQAMDATQVREIRVTSSTIVTHLARDAARKKGIQIWIDEESSSCKSVP